MPVHTRFGVIAGRYIVESLAWVLFVAAVAVGGCAQTTANASKPLNLSGLWKRDDGGIVRITQDGKRVKAVHVEVAREVRDVYDFHPGDTHFLAELQGHHLEAKMNSHLAADMRPKCPSKWIYWVDMDLTVSPDGKEIAGRWKWLHVNSNGCVIDREEWKTRQYARVLESYSGAPGRLSVVAHGKQIMPLKLELIFDASGSMWERVQGRTKIATAKEAITQIIQSLPENLQVALRVYGHRIAPGKPGACQDSELVFPFSQIDKPRLIQRIRGLRALGTTPIAYSLRQVQQDFRGSPGEKMVVLVTDGIEECNGSPSAAVSELLAQGLKLRVNIVGFAFADDATKLEMQRVAELSRGHYVDAASPMQLRSAVEKALAVPFDVLDAQGASAGAGLVDQGVVEVPEGTYKVVVQVPDGPVTVNNVHIVAHKSTTVELNPEGQTVVGRVVTQ